MDYLLEKGAGLPKPGEKWRGLLSMAASQGLEALFRRVAGQVRGLKAAPVSVAVPPKVAIALLDD